MHITYTSIIKIIIKYNKKWKSWNQWLHNCDDDSLSLIKINHELNSSYLIHSFIHSCNRYIAKFAELLQTLHELGDGCDRVQFHTISIA